MQMNPLTREMIDAGAIDVMVARDAPAVRILSDAERRESLLQTLEGHPRRDLWLFGYGSLIWNPTVRFEERRVARVTGWHRAFCLATPAGRGSVNNPGLVLGLDEGGVCDGVAVRISDNVVEAELASLWKREMLSAAYVPRWLDLLDHEGRQFGCAIAFTINRGGAHYAGHLARDQVIRQLATATGALGSSADYLFRTCEGLRAHGIPDANLERIEAAVIAIREQEA
jgi:cation transport protein ChaC